MSKLFIIGNGFDRAHNMNTGYNDFRNYLKKEYNIDEKEYPDDPVPPVNINPDDDKNMSAGEKRQIVEYLFRVFDMNNPIEDNEKYERWGNFEKSLSNMDFGYNGTMN